MISWRKIRDEEKSVLYEHTRDGRIQVAVWKYDDWIVTKSYDTGYTARQFEKNKVFKSKTKALQYARNWMNRNKNIYRKF